MNPPIVNGGALSEMARFLNSLLSGPSPIKIEFGNFQSSDKASSNSSLSNRMILPDPAL